MGDFSFRTHALGRRENERKEANIYLAPAICKALDKHLFFHYVRSSSSGYDSRSRRLGHMEFIIWLGKDTYNVIQVKNNSTGLGVWIP